MKARLASKKPPLYARIASRIFALDVLLVLVPVLALGLLGNYEKSLLESQENGMAQQARIISAWLSQGSSSLRAAEAMRMIQALERKHTVRIRVISPDFSVLADSSLAPESAAAEIPADVGGGAESTLLYRVMSLPVRIWRKYFSAPQAPLESADYYGRRSAIDGPEVREALDGRYGSATRISSGGQTSVTLYAALPIRREGKITGAVLVSQSTYKILKEIYSLRLDAAKTFAAGVLLALAMTLILSFTISFPLSRLARATREALSRPGGLSRANFHNTKRLDEIGDLERALAAFALGLEERALRAESFAADVAHELRNPLASAAASLELAAQAEEPDYRERFLSTAQAEIRRMDTLIRGLRSLAAAEAGGSAGVAGAVDKGERSEDAAAVILEAANSAARFAGIPLLVGETPKVKASLAIRPSLLASVVGNLVENAAGFSPAGASIIISLRLVKDPFESLLITVDDEGPGVPPEHLERVFERFFTWRPNVGDKRAHTGLGLAIVATAARGAGGKAWVENRPGGGASFRVSLPLASA